MLSMLQCYQHVKIVNMLHYMLQCYQHVKIVNMLQYVLQDCQSDNQPCTLLSPAAYPSTYGHFQQVLAQHPAVIPTAQKEGMCVCVWMCVYMSNSFASDRLATYSFRPVIIM